MRPQAARVERAQALLEETLVENPAGLPSIAIMDRLERWGFAEYETIVLLRCLEEEGRLRVDRGRYTLGE